MSRLDALALEELERRQRALRAIDALVATLNSAAHAIHMGTPPPVATLHHSVTAIQDHCALWAAANDAVVAHLTVRPRLVRKAS